MVLLDIALLACSFFGVSLFVTDYSFVHRSVSINSLLGPAIGLAVLLLLRWLADKKNFKGSIFVRLFLRIYQSNDRNLLIVLCGFTFLLFSLVSIARHLSLCSGAWDLGIFDQSIWNASQGNSLWCTIRFPQGGNILGDHFEPILFLIAPLYQLWPNVMALFILQSLLLASAIIPLYLIAKQRLNSRSVIFALIISYILSKPLRGIAFFDFYPESFIVPALFWAYYFLINRKNVFLGLSVIVLLLCKEDTTFLVLGLGLFAFFIQQRRGLGFFLTAVAILLWIFETSVVIPYFSSTHSYLYMTRLPFGHTYGDNVMYVISHPVAFLKFILIKPKIEYILRMLGPLGFLTLLSPSHFILFFIPLLKNLVANEKFAVFYTINERYHAGITPFIYIGAIHGCAWVLERFKIKKAYIIALILVVLSLLFHGRTDGCRLAGFLKNMKEDHTLEKIRWLQMIPAQASVAASFNLCPQLAHRKYIYIWQPIWKQRVVDPSPPGFSPWQTAYIVVDKASSLAHVFTAKELADIDQYLREAKDHGYKTIFNSADRQFLILWRGEKDA